MKINQLEISNFKGIRSRKIGNLGDVVVVAGPNGSGKSCIFDAIRLLKSMYGGYGRENEWHQFFGEFQLNINKPEEMTRLFYRRDTPIEISAEIKLSEQETQYIRENAYRRIYENYREREFRRTAHELPDADFEVSPSMKRVKEAAMKAANEIMTAVDRRLNH